MDLKNAVTKSQLIENLIYIKLTELFDNIYVFKGNHEIDFIANDWAIEVKYQNKIISSDYKNLLDLPYKALLITKNKQSPKNILSLSPEHFLLVSKS